jgi:predicted lipoprotein with Yx(FWY)xxD motif
VKRNLLLILTLALAATACGDDNGDSAAAAPDGIQITSTDLGEVLADPAGNVLYLFLPDNQGPSVCEGGCAENWPPLTESLAAGDGADASLLGTAARPDGTPQLTYNGWPLYYFAGDDAPGDTNGQGINDVWFVIDAAGEAVVAGE